MSLVTLASAARFMLETKKSRFLAQAIAIDSAEHALAWASVHADDVAVLARSQTRPDLELTWAELADQVGRCRAGLQRLGVGRGDRVAAVLPNIPETLVAFLATASLGAVWASCAPEFGVRAVVDRFGGAPFGS